MSFYVQLTSTQILDALQVTWDFCKGLFDYTQCLFARLLDLDVASA